MPVPRISVIFSTISKSEADATRGSGSRSQDRTALPVMHLVIDQRVELLTHLMAKAAIDRGHEIRFRLMYRLGRHALHDADTRDHDPTRAHLIQKPAEQRASVDDARRLVCQPCPQFHAVRAAQIAEAEARLDRGELIVARGRASGEISYDLCIHPDLLGNMVEHDRRQQFPVAQMPARVAQATKLQGVAESGGGRARGVDRGHVLT
jgi:hypothetical protein